jgi:diaminopimelate epimerase
MRHEFIKMHGLGNDFIVLDSPARDGLSLTSQQWRALSDRHRGIGFDQALVLEPTRDGQTLAFYRIYNSYGQEVEQCGNGVRCRRAAAAAGARWALLLDSPAGHIKARLGTPGIVSVDMGEPRFTPQAVAFEAAGQPGPHYSIDVQGQAVQFAIASMGNPHAVIEVPDTATAQVSTLGAALESHPRFTRRVNVGFRQIINDSHYAARTERGVRDPGLRHRRLRRRGCRHPRRPAGPARAGGSAGRHAVRELGGPGQPALARGSG